MKLVIDISSHNTINKDQWKLLSSVLDGVIIRLSFGVTEDYKAQKHIDDSGEVGLPFIGYHWVDPTWDFYRQFNRIQAVVDKFKPLGEMLDHEQYWTDWGAYEKQDLAACYATRFTPKQINDFSLKTYNWCVQFLNVSIANYSGDWFINQYSPELKWVKSRNYVEARYLRYYDATWWAKKKYELGVPFDISHIKEISEYAGVPYGVGRQFESYIPIKGLEVGMGYHLDWVNMTDSSFKEMYKVVEPPVIEPPIIEKIKRGWKRLFHIV